MIKFFAGSVRGIPRKGFALYTCRNGGGISTLFDTLIHLRVLILWYALSCTTLRVVGITTRSVVQLNLPTRDFRLGDALVG